MMNRREFLRLSALGAAGVLGGGHIGVDAVAHHGYLVALEAVLVAYAVEHVGVGLAYHHVGLSLGAMPHKVSTSGLSKVTASSYYDDWFKPEYAVDDNNGTLWKAARCNWDGGQQHVLAALHGVGFDAHQAARHRRL